jgi:hypothetical protein
MMLTQSSILMSKSGPQEPLIKFIKSAKKSTIQICSVRKLVLTSMTAAKLQLFLRSKT